MERIGIKEDGKAKQSQNLMESKMTGTANSLTYPSQLNNRGIHFQIGVMVACFDITIMIPQSMDLIS